MMGLWLQIAARMVRQRPLLSRFVDVVNHHLLLFHEEGSGGGTPTNVVDTLRRHQQQHTDPQLQWKWIRSTPTLSVLSVIQVNRGFEAVGKQSFHVRVGTGEVSVVNKEHIQINCRRDMRLLEEALQLLTANFLLNSAAMLCKSYAWQILHANNNAIDENGDAAPTLYACNQPANKQLFIQFFIGQPPAILLRRGDLGSAMAAAGGKGDMGGFQRFNYERLHGSTFMRKIDWLLAVFRG